MTPFSRIMGSKSFSVLLALISCLPVFAENTLGVRGDLHFSLEARGANTDGSLPIYKNAQASIEDRVNDLLPRMTIEEKVAQMYVDYRGLLTRMEYEGVILTYISIQGDLDGWMNLDDPLDDTLTYNQTGLVRTTRYISPPVAHFLLQEQMMAQKSGSIWGGYLTPYDKFVYGVTIGQKYLMENTTLGIPAMFQSEGLPLVRKICPVLTFLPTRQGYMDSRTREPYSLPPSDSQHPSTPHSSHKSRMSWLPRLKASVYHRFSPPCSISPANYAGDGSKRTSVKIHSSQARWETPTSPGFNQGSAKTRVAQLSPVWQPRVNISPPSEVLKVVCKLETLVLLQSLRIFQEHCTGLRWRTGAENVLSEAVQQGVRRQFGDNDSVLELRWNSCNC